jgi:hypothetical protein
MSLHAWFTILLESMGFLYTQQFLKVSQFNQPRFNFPQLPTISKEGGGGRQEKNCKGKMIQLPRPYPNFKALY